MEYELKVVYQMVEKNSNTRYDVCATDRRELTQEEVDRVLAWVNEHRLNISDFSTDAFASENFGVFFRKVGN